MTMYNRVAAWNAARYPQEHNDALSLSLLNEEFTEYTEAKLAVDKLDALCDMTFVALGMLWKLDPQDREQADVIEEAIKNVEPIANNEFFEPAYFIPSVLAKYAASTLSGVAVVTYVSQLCYLQMTRMGLTGAEVEEAILIVCDSNDSKVIKETAPDVKANIDKGADFTPPEPRLQILLDKVEARHGR